jgi:hypothetical protein
MIVIKAWGLNLYVRINDGAVNRLDACDSNLRGITLRTKSDSIADGSATLIAGMVHWISSYSRTESQARTVDLFLVPPPISTYLGLIVSYSGLGRCFILGSGRVRAPR